MIFVTGDLHGHNDIRKLTAKRWPEGTELSKDDFLVICGDFGLVWAWSSRDRYWLDWLSARPWTTLWVDGNHENHDLIDSFPTEELFGGRAQRVPGHPDIIHLMRGEVYDLPDAAGSSKRCFVMGGASSTDREWREEGVSWWAREMPSQAEYDHATESLERVGWSVDYVFTHTCPAKLVDYALLNTISEMRHPAGGESFDMLENFLQWVDDKLDKDRLKRWYFGHYHGDFICRDEQHALLYQQVVPLGEPPYEDSYI